MGTVINAIFIIIGASIGLLIGAKLSDSVKNTITSGLGLFTIALGIKMFLESGNVIVVLLGLLLGVLIGEWWRIEDFIQGIGSKIEVKFFKESKKNSTFVKGFMSSSILFVAGPMAILGAIQDGLTGDYQLLLVKSVMDGFTSIALASSLGLGVVFSSVMVFAYQGILTLLATQVAEFMTTAMVNDLSGIGGVMLIGIGISSLLEIKKIRIGNFIPALFITPILTIIFVLLKIY